jgi:hypothetical protein
VLLPDLLGRGEIGPGDFRGDAYSFKQGNASFNLWFAAIQVGRSLVGIDAGDINRLAMYLQSRDDVIADRISGYAVETTAPALLHAAVFGTLFASITLKDSYGSYESLVMSEYYQPRYMLSAVPAALIDYDLPDLCSALAPLPLTIVSPVNPNGGILSEQETSTLFKGVVQAYTEKQAADQFTVEFE